MKHSIWLHTFCTLFVCFFAITLLDANDAFISSNGTIQKEVSISDQENEQNKIKPSERSNEKSRINTFVNLVTRRMYFLYGFYYRSKDDYILNMKLGNHYTNNISRRTIRTQQEGRYALNKIQNASEKDDSHSTRRTIRTQ